MNQEMIAYIQKLARLELTEAEKDRMKEDLAEMLNYIELLEEMDTSETAPMSHVHPFCNGMREDKTAGMFGAEKVLENAPLREGDYFVVPKTFS